MMMLFGLVFMGAGLLCWVVIGSAMGEVPAGDVPSLMVMRYIMAGSFGGVGLLAFIPGVFAFRSGRKEASYRREALENGVDSTGKITYLSPNYRITVNERPIFTIIEYIYQDSLGYEFTDRINNANSEKVIRAGWQVGSEIPIKYLSAEPEKSAIVL